MSEKWFTHTTPMLFNAGTSKPQIYHYTNEGVVSWYDFAYAILKNLPVDTL